MVIVSHDRAFLERTVTSVLELDDHTHAGTEYRGGFRSYLDARAVARRHAEEQYAAYAGERTRLSDRARRQRQWAVQGTAKAKRDPTERDKFIRHFRVDSSEQLAAKARATDRALERLAPVEKPWEGWELRLDIAPARRSGDLVARLTGAVVARGQFRLGPVDLEIRWAERVVIAGPNGTGKTTLLHTLLGRLPLERGERRIGPGVVVGEMDQLRSRFAADVPLLEVFQRQTGLVNTEARALLAKFGLGADHALREAATLSPGERTRAVLAGFAAAGVNCLVLDEPTNHLDLPAIEQLEQALESYNGTLLLVTHDRRLLDAVRVTRMIGLSAGRMTSDRVETRSTRSFAK
jgi:ATPase subunit of ABC transporter with duplicated ATPase domains